MCRFFAVRAGQPRRVADDLLHHSNALRRQSRCDARGYCSDSGWGIGLYADAAPQVVTSIRPAFEDSLFATTAESVTAALAIAHVRRAGVGPVSRENCQPFVHGKWLFAHNGLLADFAEAGQRLREETPDHLVCHIRGQTDSEAAFYFLLGLIERRSGSLSDQIEPALLAECLADGLRSLARSFPPTDTEPTLLNVLLADGESLLASRWGNTLFLRQQEAALAEHRCMAVASEQTETEGWAEVPNQSVLVVRNSLNSLILRTV